MSGSQKIKIVFFDALFTIVQPRIPIFKQYQRVLTPHVGWLEEDRLKGSFKTALRELQKERPAYSRSQPGKTGPAADAESVRGWWSEVVRRTAVRAGAESDKVDEHLDEAVTELLHIFSSKEGYKLVDGALPTLIALNDELGVRTGLVSNADSRILKALEDLGAMRYLNPAVVSEHEGIEKPDQRIWSTACGRAGLVQAQAAHVGDEYNSDVIGAKLAGLRPIWFRPPGETHVEEDEKRDVPEGVVVAKSLLDVVAFVREWNKAAE